MVNECQITSHIIEAHLMAEPADAMNLTKPKHDFGAYDARRIWGFANRTYEHRSLSAVTSKLMTHAPFSSIFQLDSEPSMRIYFSFLSEGDGERLAVMTPVEHRAAFRKLLHLRVVATPVRSIISTYTTESRREDRIFMQILRSATTRPEASRAKR
jgi:hypothetical protein